MTVVRRPVLVDLVLGAVIGVSGLLTGFEAGRGEVGMAFVFAVVTALAVTFSVLWHF